MRLFDRWLRVELAPGRTADFHYRWLRHNCDCDRHPVTRERTLCSSELPERVAPASVALEQDALTVRWAHDGHESRYPLAWLEEHAYAPDREGAPPPSSEVAAVRVRAQGRPLASVLAEALRTVERFGLAVGDAEALGATPPETHTEPLLEGFAAQGLAVVGTHFGRIEDLRTDNTTNENTDQLGYTDAAVDLHTDQPFLEAPPRYQLLQCVRAAPEGGANYLADARQAYRYLASLDPGAARLLAEVPVRFHRKQQRFERVLESPLIARAGEDFFLRFSYFTLAPYRLPFEQMEAFYAAHDAFARLVRDPRHQYRFTLQPGEWVLYDNHRMLHARTAFRGARWLRGVYFNR